MELAPIPMSAALPAPAPKPKPKPAFDAAQWPLISSLFDTGAALEPAARSAWLVELQREHPQLAPQVLALLAAHAERETADWLEAGPLLPSAETAVPDAAQAEHQAGQTVGRYRLLEFVARGGMAEVWRAQALEGPAQRVVALKLPLAHRLGSVAAARFAREGEILASLAHPHIAPLYDAGVAQGGTPYLAMEWVAGKNLMAWCDEHHLGVRERLGLFLQVLDAVAYAHAHLVIHRDLKPSNILVSEEGQVRLLDFGIAKMLAADQRAEVTELTQQAGRMMTAAYAAPEQVSGQTLTPAADVYALGVLLFELLTGQRPYKLKFQSAAQLEQAIEAADVQKPSAVVQASGDADLHRSQQEWAARRGFAQTPRLARALRGDLDAIVGKALQREPARRYDNARALAEDITRHLQERPVLAQPESLAYSFKRLVARHRAAAAAGVFALTALVLGLGAALWQGQRAERERAIAERERQSAVAANTASETVNRFMESLLVEAARGKEPVTVPQLLTRAEGMARSEFKNEPNSLAQVLFLIGSHRAEVDGPAVGRPLMEEALRISNDEYARPGMQCEVASQQGRQGDQVEQAERLLERLGRDPAVKPITRATCLGYQADFQQDRGEPVAALATTQRAYAQWEASRERWPQNQAALLTRLGSRLLLNGRAAEANATFEQALALVEKMQRGRGMTGIGLRNQWGFGSFMAGEPARAMGLYDQNLKVLEEDKPGSSPPAVFIFNAANARVELGRYDQALSLLGRAAQVADQTGDAPMRLRTRCQAAIAAARQGDKEVAARWLEQASQQPAAPPPGGQLAQANCRQAQAEAALGRGDSAAALSLADALLAGAPPLQAHTAAAVKNLRAAALLQAGRLADAQAAADQALQAAKALQTTLPQSHRSGLALLTVAQVAQAQGQSAAAQNHAQLAAQALSATVDAAHPALKLAQQLAGAQSSRP
jgi:eukaryotic-like serine/threonine-protein kinase